MLTDNDKHISDYVQQLLNAQVDEADRLSGSQTAVYGDHQRFDVA